MEFRRSSVFAVVFIVGATPCFGQVVVQRAPVAAARDSAARPPADSVATSKPALPKRAAPAAPAAPVDTALAAACAGAGDIASDLVVVVFEPGVSAAERAKAAQRVGGVLISRPGAPEDESYVRVGSGADIPSTQALADRLIQLAQVRSVSLAPCPPPQPPPPTPSDTGRTRP